MHSEKLLPLVKAIEQATGFRPHLSTAIRWTAKPNRFGHRLESVEVGGRRMTSIDAVHRYNDANTAAADPLALTSSTARQRSAAHDRAMLQLAKAGI